MQFQDPISTYDFLVRGWAETSLPPFMAGALLRKLSSLQYIPLPADHCDAGPRERARLESNPSSATFLRKFWESLVQDDLKSLASYYRVGADPSMISVLKLGSGYSLDWHNHLAERGTAVLLVYLFDGPDAGEGGDLVLGDLQRDMTSIVETKRFKIAHGSAILMGDNSHPLLMHKAEEWAGQGSRYLILFAFNTPES